MSGAELVLHLGAHRTASTRIQADLDANAELLRAQGIVALTPPRPGKRDTETLRDILRACGPAAQQGWPRRLLARRALRQRLDRLIAEAAGDATPRRIILSDEMALDVAFAPDGTAVYPRAEPRLTAFRDLLGRDVAELHLTIRDYAGFLTSAYAMRAVYAGPLPPFRNLAPRLLALDRGWPDLVVLLRRLFPGARLTVSTLDGHPIAARLADLAGQALDLVHEGADQPNIAPTVQAIEAACRLGQRAADPDRLVADHAGGARFDPLTAEEKAALTLRYRRDLDLLRADPAITVKG